MSNPFHYIIPVPQPDVEEVFAVYRTTQDFYHEVEVRQAFEQHCQWYEQVAQQNRQDLQQMRREVNVMGWFYGNSDR